MTWKGLGRVRKNLSNQGDTPETLSFDIIWLVRYSMVMSVSAFPLY